MALLGFPSKDPQFFPQLFVFFFKLLHLCFKPFGLLLCAYAKFLDNLEDPPQTQEDDQRCYLLDGAIKNNIKNEGCSNHQGIEYVEL